MTEVASEGDTQAAGRGLSRRQFLRTGGAAAAVGTVGLLVGNGVLGSSRAEAATASAVKYGFVIDLERCMGCKACMEACKVENNTGEGIFWMYVFRLEEGEYPDVNWTFMPRPCMHCDNPPCVKVCPTRARYKRPAGFVLQDQARCIGCKFCVVACPYGVNYFNWKQPTDNQYYDWKKGEGDNVYGNGRVRDYIGTNIPPYRNPDHEKLYGVEQRLVSGGGHFLGVVEKCSWCVHRVEKGLLPACVANCPVHALHFGDLEDPQSEVSELLRRKRSFRLLEHVGTNPRVHYVGAPQPSLHAQSRMEEQALVYTT